VALIAHIAATQRGWLEARLYQHEGKGVLEQAKRRALHVTFHGGQIAALVRQHGGEPSYTDFIQVVRTGAVALTIWVEVFFFQLKKRSFERIARWIQGFEFLTNKFYFSIGQRPDGSVSAINSVIFQPLWAGRAWDRTV
jgi:hypothetical protein